MKGKNNEKKKRSLSAGKSRKIRRKGHNAERELARKLRKLGFKSVRIPLSGCSSQPLPDLFATKNDKILAFEVKAPNSERAYFRKNQVEKLFEFLNLFDAYPKKMAVLGAKFPYKWVFKRVERIENFVIIKDDKNTIRLAEC